MKTIKDTIHGNINFTESEIALLDTPEMQRLRNIKELGFTYLVYPSATHTRFEHSLGTFHLAEKLAQNLNLNKEQTQKLKTAALLHDIGHGPFSHSSEDAIQAHLGNMYTHESNTEKIIKQGRVAELLKDSGLSPNEIAEISTGKKPPLGEIIAGEIDVDRMDYLVRDSYYTGTAYGVIDLDRLLQVLKIYQKKLVIGENGLSSAEAIVRARYLMYPSVYQHHATRIANSMFSFAVLHCLTERVFSIEELYAMDDISVISTLRNSNTIAGELLKRVEQRNLYKRAAVLDKTDLKNNYRKLLNLKSEKLKALEIEIQESTGLKQGEVLLDIPKPLYVEEAKASIMHKGKLKPLSEVSPLVKDLTKAQWSYWNIAVYCSKENLRKVGKSARDILLGY